MVAAGTLLQDVPFVVSLQNNRGTAALPVNNCYGVVIPSMRLMDAPDMQTIGKLVQINVKGQADRPAGGDLVQIFARNSRVVTY